MAYFENYEKKPITPGYVEKEGVYELVIQSVREDVIQEKNTRFLQVECQINAKNYPHVSIFLTEGDNFNGNLTAFIDTFGINDYRNPNTWINHSGFVFIKLGEKNGYKTMTPRYILDQQGFVTEEIKSKANAVNRQNQQHYNNFRGPDGGTYSNRPFNSSR